MSNSYDIDEVTEQVINWLRGNYPLAEIAHTRRRPEIAKVTTKAGLWLIWERLPIGWYGAASGYQHNTELYLNSRQTYDIETLVKTICHEWCHLLQDLRLYNWYSRRLKVDYWSNPFEIEADLFAEMCWDELGEVFSTRYSRCAASLESPDIP